MHKKLKDELVCLAHSLLQMKNKDDIDALQQKIMSIYEKLSVLKFVDTYIENTENKSDSNDENTIEEQQEAFVSEETVNKTTVETKQVIEEEILIEKSDEVELDTLQFTLESEFKDAISADIATQMFENATKENPAVQEESQQKKRSLNDAFTNNLQVGLNDRIAFVKHLFDGSQEDFNRVLSQLNTFKSENEAKDFIKNLVKPDYDWSTKEEYEVRLIELIERKFL